MKIDEVEKKILPALEFENHIEEIKKLRNELLNEPSHEREAEILNKLKFIQDRIKIKTRQLAKKANDSKFGKNYF